MLIEGLKSHYDVEKKRGSKRHNMPREKLTNYGASQFKLVTPYIYIYIYIDTF